VQQRAAALKAISFTPVSLAFGQSAFLIYLQDFKMARSKVIQRLLRAKPSAEKRHFGDGNGRVRRFV
jgi:hypothetical protein